MERIPVYLVTGFLGSGKTTLLRQMAMANPGQRLLFLVNEFASQSVDGPLLEQTGHPSLSVVGGSLFCECKAGDFIRMMEETVLGIHASTPIDAVVIETSGIADPGAIGELMENHGLERHFAVRSILAVVSPLRFCRLLEGLPAAEAQIRCSDAIILNKMDLVDRSTADAVRAAIRRINPTATIAETSYCACPVDLSGDSARALPHHPLVDCDANPFSTRMVDWPVQGTMQAFRTWIDSLPATILRLKGTPVIDGQVWRAERTIDHFTLEPAPDASAASLVLIAHDDNEADLDRASEAIHGK